MTTYKIEFGNESYCFTPTESDEWQYFNGYDYHYSEEDKTISVYEVKDIDKPFDYMNAVYVYKIK